MSVDPLAIHLQKMLEFEARCSGLVVASLRDADQRVRQVGLASLAVPLERAVAIFAHVQAARQLWLSRVSKLTGFPDGGVFPAWTIDHSERVAREMDTLYEGFIRARSVHDLMQGVEYTSTESVKYESQLSEILTHVVNHGSYHRGQIAQLIAQTGNKPPVTDFIAITRRKM